ncbi:RES family NAD+ phosphorylase [Polaromonas sp.]|uniref:RES family NAD+ phosphorylase n=1 Tax=Polaromonas sp. TaxID=1869339 RepID=UPI003BB66012
MYAAQDAASALMETVLHDVPSPSAGFIYVAPAPEDRQLATLVNQVPLQLGDLKVMCLKRLGLSGAVVIDGDKPTYGDTRDFAQALHTARSDIQGLVWDSRQTKKQAIVLFEDRLHPGALACLDTTPVSDGSVQSILYDLLETLGAAAI